MKKAGQRLFVILNQHSFSLKTMMSAFHKFLTRGLDWLTFFASALAAIILSLIVAIYAYEVVARYFFSAPTGLANDFVSYALCAMIFLALPRVTMDRTHVAVTILVDSLPKLFADVVHVAVSLLGFASLSFAAWISLQENIRQFTRGINMLAIIPIPQWWVSSFITFGLGLSALYFLKQISHRNRVVNQ